VIIPESCILIDYMMLLGIDLLKNLVFDHESIERNLHMSKGRIMAESVMILLVKKGVGRQVAHELIRTCAMKSYERDVQFKDVLMKNASIVKHVTAAELDAALDPEKYIGTAVQQVEAVIKELGQAQEI
jgi:adenylosuccinate lyase